MAVEAPNPAGPQSHRPGPVGIAPPGAGYTNAGTTLAAPARQPPRAVRRREAGLGAYREVRAAAPGCRTRRELAIGGGLSLGRVNRRFLALVPAYGYYPGRRTALSVGLLNLRKRPRAGADAAL